MLYDRTLAYLIALFTWDDGFTYACDMLSPEIFVSSTILAGLWNHRNRTEPISANLALRHSSVDNPFSFTKISVLLMSGKTLYPQANFTIGKRVEKNARVNKKL